MSSVPSKLWLVGESFQGVTALQPHFVTRATLRSLLEETTPLGVLSVHPGLGIDLAEWSALREELTRTYGGTLRFTSAPPKPVSRHLVLKRAHDNVLIGNPRLHGDGFWAELLVPNDTEMLRDHTAERQHVPGMLLIEAAAQMITWAVSQRVPPAPNRPARYAVMHGCQVEFERFVLPYPTELVGSLKVDGQEMFERAAVSGRLTVQQLGRACSHMQIRLQAFDPEHFYGIEDAQARQAAHLALHSPGASDDARDHRSIATGAEVPKMN